jgi:hypothetical protein
VTVFRSPPPEVVRALRAEAERPLTPDEIRALDALPLGNEEREENLALIDWFSRRYPTPEARLRYARRAYRRWKSAMPVE